MRMIQNGIPRRSAKRKESRKYSIYPLCSKNVTSKNVLKNRCCVKRVHFHVAVSKSFKNVALKLSNLFFICCILSETSGEVAVPR